MVFVLEDFMNLNLVKSRAYTYGKVRLFDSQGITVFWIGEDSWHLHWRIFTP